MVFFDKCKSVNYWWTNWKVYIVFFGNTPSWVLYFWGVLRRKLNWNMEWRDFDVNAYSICQRSLWGGGICFHKRLGKRICGLPLWNKGSNHHYIACYAMAVDRHSTNNLMENSRVVQPEWNGFICDMLFYKVLDYSAKTQGSWSDFFQHAPQDVH